MIPFTDAEHILLVTDLEHILLVTDVEHILLVTDVEHILLVTDTACFRRTHKKIFVKDVVMYAVGCVEMARRTAWYSLRDITAVKIAVLFLKGYSPWCVIPSDCTSIN